MENKKMINAATSLDTLTKVVGEIFRAVGIVCAIMAVLVAILGEKMIGTTGETSITLGFVKLYAAENLTINTSFMTVYIIVGLITVGILCFAVHYASKIIRAILEPVKAGRPFESNVPANLRKIAWMVLICGGVTQIIHIIECVVLTNVFPMDEIISSDAIARFEYTYTVDFGFALVFAVIMFLSYVFAYGQRLQEESDETL